MSSFEAKFTQTLRIHPSIAWSVGACTEARGLQELWARTRPELVSQLRESAIIQSTESSNRIEGVEIEKKRLLPLLAGRTKPRDRSEEEVLGYRKALDLIHRRPISITPEAILKLHSLCQGGLVSDAGRWKTRDNEIVEFTPTGDRRIRFQCVSARETPKAVSVLCRAYNAEIERQEMPDLLVIANFIFDFLCIHPFRDGNGRVSRLLTLACLMRANYKVGQVISLERIVEESKADYYEALGKSSQGWHESRHDLYPWWAFFLGHIRSAYQELKDRVENTPQRGTKTSIVYQTVMAQLAEFQISDILNLHPDLDREIVKKALAQMKAEGLIEQIGAGRGSRWRRV